MPMDDDTQPALLQRRNLASLVLVNMGVGTHAIVWFMVVTAMPSVVDDLRAAPYLSWATSIYLVSTILGGASMALLKARLGARPALVLAGIVVMAGGLLAAAAPGIALVLVGRVLQGLGEGVLVALSYALVRELFDTVGGFPEQPLMEDIEISKRLRRIVWPRCLSAPVVTDSRRWRRRGVVRTILLMWWLRWAYAVGVSPTRLAEWYR